MTSILININKIPFDEQFSELLCNWMSYLECNYLAAKLHLSSTNKHSGASVKGTPTPRDTIPIFLHQDYNYNQYGKFCSNIHRMAL